MKSHVLLVVVVFLGSALAAVASEEVDPVATRLHPPPDQATTTSPTSPDLLSTPDEHSAHTEEITTPCLETSPHATDRFVPLSYIKTGLECVTGDHAVKELGNFTSMDDFKPFLNAICHRVPTIQECVSKLTSQSERCLNDSRHIVFEIIFDTMQSALDTGCRVGGDAFATIFLNTFVDIPSVEDIYRQCLDLINIKYALKNRSDQDAADHLYNVYRHLTTAKECLVERFRDEDRKTEIGNFMDELLPKMKCLNPADNSHVLCSVIHKSRNATSSD